MSVKAGRRWFDVSLEDAQAEFFGAWDKVRYLPGFDPLRNALEHARRKPLQLKPETAARRPDGYAAFVSIAGWLQVGAGDRNILLPFEDLGDMLGVEPMTISRYRRWAKEDGFLKEVKPYEFHGKGGGGKAAEFRFDVPRFPVLRDTARDGTSESFMASP